MEFLNCCKIYRKAALKLVQDLGEEAFPEPKVVEAAQAAVSSDPAFTQATATEEASPATATKPQEPLKTVSSQEPPPNEPSVAEQPPSANFNESPVTTVERKPMTIPDSVHVRITPDNLKEYVGPPIYQKDRLYAHPPPPGVSTGLGYLGNGSGAVMPVEAMVRTYFYSS